MTQVLSASFSTALRVELDDEPGAFSRLATAIAEAGGSLGSIELLDVSGGKSLREVVVLAADREHALRIVEAARAVANTSVVAAIDRTLEMHAGGKIAMHSRVPLRSRDDLSMAYTPGVARVCEEIAQTPSRVWDLTAKQNTVAVVSDGSAVLGLGDIGPAAALPVMEGKAVLFKEFADVDAWPLCLDARDPDQIVEIVKSVASGFGGINLEDISAPRCFEIERRLDDELDIPVFHDDQHGTAIVTVAALVNALKIVDKQLENIRIVIAGVGAAGHAVTGALLEAGAGDIVGCDRRGAIHEGRNDLDEVKAEYATRTNSDRLSGSVDDVLKGADVFIGLSRPGSVSIDGVRSMASHPIVFAMANPIPEIDPEAAAEVAVVVATGRSDYPNQINNVLAFPGVFRGALDVRAERITPSMRAAAATAIAETVTDAELSPARIIPDPFDQRVALSVAAAIRKSHDDARLAENPVPALALDSR